MNSNTSSAIPRGHQPPPLSTSIRARLPLDQIARAVFVVNPIDGRPDPDKSDFHFRLLEPSDREVVKALHEEWFPLSYGENFYDTAVGTEYFSMAAVWRRRTSVEKSSDVLSRWVRFMPSRFLRPLVDNEAIVGMGIMSFDFGIDPELPTRISGVR